METQRFVHRTLRAKSILVEGDISGVKIGNFGLARQLDANGEFDARRADTGKGHHSALWIVSVLWNQ